MAIRDYWVYQKRDTPKPWALYIVKEYDKRFPESVVIDYTFYHEDIENATKAISFVDLHHDGPRGYADEIMATIREFSEVFDTDYRQVLNEIARIIED